MWVSRTWSVLKLKGIIIIELDPVYPPTARAILFNSVLYDVIFSGGAGTPRGKGGEVGGCERTHFATRNCPLFRLVVAN